MTNRDQDLIERLTLPVSESMFVRKSDMLRTLFAERSEAATALASSAKRIAEEEQRNRYAASELVELEGRIADLRIQLSTLQSELDEARAALEPFAQMFDAMADNLKSDDREVWGYNNVTLYKRDFRRARAATRTTGGDNGE